MKATKVKEISQETKQIVLARQNNRSVTKVYLTDYNTEFHHVISRGNQGVGYEWNIVAITSDEHRRYHDHSNIQVNGRDRYTWKEMETLMKNHLKLNYSGWSEEKCRYHKYWEYEDYGVKRYEQTK